MKEFEAKVRLNEENGGKTGELDIMSPPPFDKGYFNGVTFGITFKEPVFEASEGMSVEEYRQRLMKVFHSTDHDELLTYVVMPKEEEFKSLEYILRQYNFEPRLRGEWIIHRNKQGAHIYSVCSKCNVPHLDTDFPNFCENCGSDNRKKEDKPHGS